MQSQGLWGKFRHAIEDMDLMAKNVPGVGLVGAALHGAQRFYLPEAYNPIEGRLLDAEMQQSFKLPFPVTAVLSECDFYEDARTSTGLIDRADVISIGIEPEYWRRFMPNPAYDVFQEPGYDGGWALFAANYSNNLRRWISLPFIGIARYRTNAPGVELQMIQPPPAALGACPAFSKEQLDLLLVDFQRDLNRLQNLCLMLSCHNVEAHKIIAPAKLNKARALRKKAPLPDYHVLRVDGHLWDQNPTAGSGDSHGVRSHFRRGHRREYKPGKYTWVTQTMVQGSAPGFVHKDYEIPSPAKV